jgi:hypothetical protein
MAEMDGPVGIGQGVGDEDIADGHVFLTAVYRRAGMVTILA